MNQSDEQDVTPKAPSSFNRSAIFRYRDELKKYAAHFQSRRFRPRFDDSDVVQETLLTAGNSFQGFTGSTKPQLLVWLRSILENRFHDLCRYHSRQKRDARRESPVEQFAHPEERPFPGSDAAGPLSDSLEKALKMLAPRTQTVITMKCFENKSFLEIAAHLNSSPDAVRKIWERGIKQLKQRMTGQSVESSSPDRFR